jgi:nickel/cobalt exporter
MNSAVFTTITATGFTVAFFHAAIPTHWLPFVLVGGHWNRAKTLLVTALLCALGLLVVFFEH